MKRAAASWARLLSQRGSLGLGESAARITSSLPALSVIRTLPYHEVKLQAVPSTLPASAYTTSTTPPSHPPGAGTAAPAAKSAAEILQVQSVQDFQALLSLSQQGPVILDCFATWCGPCKQLEPELKSAVAATGGAVKLAKLDIDNPALAPLVQQMQVTSVPTMFLIFNGRMLDVKQGVPPKEELRSWIAEAVIYAEEQLGRPLGGGKAGQEGAAGQDPKKLLEAGFAALDAPDTRAADVAPLFGAVLQEGSGADAGDKARALAGLAMCALVDDPPSLDTAKQLVANAKEAAPPVVSDEVSRAASLVELASETAQAADADPRAIQELQGAVESNPRDVASLFTLALRLFEAGRHQEAIDAGLALVKADRDWRQQAGKRLLLLFFDALGADSQLAKAGRRRLSSLWFM